jgi:hypothetical protein
MCNKAQWYSGPACTDGDVIGSGLKALGSIPYKCMYIILFYFTIQFYFNFPFNYIYSLDAQSKTLLRYIHFTFVTLTVKSITRDIC